MGRPTFTLTDDQARQLAAQVAALDSTYPLDRGNHRPFVRGFLRAVLDATGRLHSEAIYRRLLGAFAPERKPSTATIGAEKQALAAELATRPALAAVASAQAVAPDTALPLQLHAIVSDAVDAALARGARYGGGQSFQSDFYAARLQDAERELQALRAEAARLAAELALARQAAALHEQEAQRARSSLASQSDTIAKLCSEVADSRKFALQAIDEARGETRIWKERSTTLEAKRQVDARLLETFRRQAYRAGAPIPDALREEKPQ